MRELMRRALAVFVTVTAPRVVLCVLLIIGSACAVIAVFELAGTPGALLTAAAICFALARLILRGLDNDV